MRILIVLLLLAAPAEAVTYRLTGSALTSCQSQVTLPDGTLDPAPCIGQVGKSFDGRVRLSRAQLGPLRDRWLYYTPGLAIDPQMPESAFRVRLGFPWEGEKSVGLHFNRWGGLDRWWFTTSREGNTIWNEAAWQGIHASTPEFYATGSPGRWAKVAWRPKATALAAPSPVPLPASAWLLIAGLLLMLALRQAGLPLVSCRPV